jgi:hypothetical protein
MQSGQVFQTDTLCRGHLQCAPLFSVMKRGNSKFVDTYFGFTKRSNRSEAPDRVLATHERQKQKKDIVACLTFPLLWYLRMVSSVKQPKLCGRNFPP